MWCPLLSIWVCILQLMCCCLEEETTLQAIDATLHSDVKYQLAFSPKPRRIKSFSRKVELLCQIDPKDHPLEVGPLEIEQTIFPMTQTSMHEVPMKQVCFLLFRVVNYLKKTLEVPLSSLKYLLLKIAMMPKKIPETNFNSLRGLSCRLLRLRKTASASWIDQGPQSEPTKAIIVKRLNDGGQSTNM